MKVLLVHNFYQQPGGEDQVFAREGALLEARGHEVLRYTRHNDDITGMNRFELLKTTVSNAATHSDLCRLIRAERPDIMHCHNTFPLISPSAYHAAKAMNLPVVQTLHNYRLCCPKAVLFRDGRLCESCLGRGLTWPAIKHGCYRGSRSASAAVTAMLAYHRARSTWTEHVGRYIALTKHARDIFVQAGLPAGIISVKPNFLEPDPGPGTGAGDYAVFAGRLSEEKGIATLLEAWRLARTGLRLKILGDGPMADQVAQAAADDARMDWLGHKPEGEVLDLIGEAKCLIMPSVWYETFGLSMIEAFARGTPVIASRLGAMQRIVSHEETGLLHTPGAADDLARAIERVSDQPDMLLRMRVAARAEYERHYTADENIRQLLDIYTLTISDHAAGRA